MLTQDSDTLRMIFLFGYIKPQKSELLVREFEEYGGVYCTLCRKLGKDYGPAARLLLNYDCTFYVLLMFSVSGKDCPEFKKGHCTVNPLKKCVFCDENAEEFSEASALTMILAYYKIKDNIADSRFFKRLFFRLMYPIVFLAHRRAAKKYPELEKIAANTMKDQDTVEHLENSEIDRCAEPTAQMLAQVFEHSVRTDSKNDSPKTRVLHEFGYFLGRWTYLIDAADDIAKDIKQKAFNPFIKKFNLNENSSQEALDYARIYANQVLNGTLAQLEAAANLLEFNRFGAIVRNIVTLGLPFMQKERLFKKENSDVRSL